MVAPPEPDASVTRVVDEAGRAWQPLPHSGHWYVVDHSLDTRSWGELVERFGPLTAEVPDPIVVTDKMARAAEEVELVLSRESTNADALRQRMIAGLRAGGYEVAE